MEEGEQVKRAPAANKLKPVWKNKNLKSHSEPLRRGGRNQLKKIRGAVSFSGKAAGGDFSIDFALTGFFHVPANLFTCKYFLIACAVPILVSLSVCLDGPWIFKRGLSGVWFSHLVLGNVHKV